MMTVAAAIDIFSVPVELVRKQTGYYSDDGVFRVGAITLKTTVRACVQLASGEQLMDVEEGIRNEAKAFAWSRSELLNGDVITWTGQQYRVLAVNKRGEGMFTRAVLGLEAA